MRELENEVLRAMALSEGEISPEDLSERVRRGAANGQRASEQAMPPVGTLKEMMEDVEKRILRRALEENGGKVARAARALGLSRAGLHKKINKYGMGSR